MKEIITLALFVLAVTGGVSVIYLSHENSKLIEDYNNLAKINNKEKCILYDVKEEEYTNKSIANGIYWIGKDFYCVWANNRTMENIERTDRHEYCHYLIDNDYNHFCKGVPQ